MEPTNLITENNIIRKKYINYIIYVILIIVFIFLLSKISFCHEKTISINKIDLEEYIMSSATFAKNVFPMEVVEKYRKPVGICTFPDGGMSKNVDFTISVFEDNQKTKLLAYFDKKDLGLLSLGASRNIKVFPYNDEEYEIIIPANGPDKLNPTEDTIYLRINKPKKTVSIIPRKESKYVISEEESVSDFMGKISDSSKKTYKELEQYFQEPRKVIRAFSDSRSVLLYLDDGRQVTLNGFYSTDEKDGTLDYKSMQKFLDNNVLNNYVNVSLPSETFFARQGYGQKSKYLISNISEISNVKVFISGELLNRKIKTPYNEGPYNLDYTDREVLKQIYYKIKNEFNKEYTVKKINDQGSILLNDGKIIFSTNYKKLDNSLVGKTIVIKPLSEEEFIQFNLDWNGDRGGFYKEEEFNPWKPYGKIFVSDFIIK